MVLRAFLSYPCTSVSSVVLFICPSRPIEQDWASSLLSAPEAQWPRWSQRACQWIAPEIEPARHGPSLSHDKREYFHSTPFSLRPFPYALFPTPFSLPPYGPLASFRPVSLPQAASCPFSCEPGVPDSDNLFVSCDFPWPESKIRHSNAHGHAPPRVTSGRSCIGSFHFPPGTSRFLQALLIGRRIARTLHPQPCHPNQLPPPSLPSPFPS